jgi:mannose-6-phosphate isomerase-like protein (cupin superfamily)
MRLGDSSSTFVVVEWTADADTSRDRPIAGLHLHREEDEAWVVLEGRLGFRVGERAVEAGPGEGIFVSRGTPHSYWNAVTSQTRYLLVMGPQTAALVEELHRPGVSDYAAVFERHGSELLG